MKSDGNIVHQRQYPRMVLIAIEDKGENLEFTAPGKQPISIPKTCSLARNGFIRVEYVNSNGMVNVKFLFEVHNQLTLFVSIISCFSPLFHSLN